MASTVQPVYLLSVLCWCILPYKNVSSVLCLFVCACVCECVCTHAVVLSTSTIKKSVNSLVSLKCL